MQNHRALLGVVALAVVDLALFMTSGIPRYRDATTGTDLWIGQICWLGFLVGLLALIVIGVVALTRRLRRSRAQAH
jgi:hypothetical protein